MQCSIGSCSTTEFALLEKSDRFPGMMYFISFPLGYGPFFFLILFLLWDWRVVTDSQRV